MKPELLIKFPSRVYVILYVMRRPKQVVSRWHLGYWSGHLRLVTPWRIYGVIVSRSARTDR